MPDLLQFLSAWWKQVIGFAILCTALATGILLLETPKYLSEATALRASSYTNDKASIFNKNIEGLYSTLGSPDDLDMIVGTAQLDTVYLFMTDRFNLVSHYKFKSKTPTTRRKAAIRLRKNSWVMKSGYGELKVMVWDADKYLAADLANAIMSKLQEIHQGILNESNVSTLNALQATEQALRHSLDTLQKSNAANSAGDQAAQASMHDVQLKQLQQYEELIGEYRLVVDTKQPALLVIENARPGIKPDKPHFLSILISTFAMSLLFGLVLALILDRRKKSTLA